MSKDEKRRHPRVKDEGISLKVRSGDVDIITKSLDISASGVYCKVEKEIPVMSRIKVILILPLSPKDRQDARESAKIETEGVVVRGHPVIVDGKIEHYDIAVFFDNISAKQKECLLEYVGKKTGKA